MGISAPVRRQRLSAYALVVRDNAVLLSQLSGRSTRPGAWTLPGGGLDHGEDPRAALVREVYEETGLHAQPGRLVDLHSLHHEGIAPDGVLEDFHAVQMVFEASVATDSPAPHVVEQDGTTAAAAWVPLDEIAAGTVEVVELVHLVLAAEGAPGNANNAHKPQGVVPTAAMRRNPELWRQRVDMLRAEFEAYAAAASAGDVTGVAESLADMLSVIYGTAMEYGLPVSAVFSKVHYASKWGTERG